MLKGQRSPEAGAVTTTCLVYEDAAGATKGPASPFPFQEDIYRNLPRLPWLFPRLLWVGQKKQGDPDLKAQGVCCPLYKEIHFTCMTTYKPYFSQTRWLFGVWGFFGGGTPVAYQCSWARGQFGATATGLHHGH